MSKSPEELFEERYGRWKTAVEVKVPDRVPLTPSIYGSWAGTYSGFTAQEIYWDVTKSIQAHTKLIQDFPEWDSICMGVLWCLPMFESTGQTIYRLPGKDLSPDLTLQFYEKTNMFPEEYDEFAEDPIKWILEKFYPRICTELAEPGSARAFVGILKAAWAFANFFGALVPAFMEWEQKYGMPRNIGGWSKCPYDVLGDKVRGMEIMTDLYRRPDKVKKACEAIVPYLITLGRITGGFAPKYPVMFYLHRGNVPFMTLEHFEEFYWPTFKETVLGVVEAGHLVRFYTEGDWGHNLEYLNELPKGKVIIHLDRTDIVKAKEIIGDNLCIEGNIPTPLLALGTPNKVEEYVKKICEECMEGGGFIMDGAGGIPDEAPLENVKAMNEATLKYGQYRR